MVKCTMVYIKHSQWSECVPCPLITWYQQSIHWLISLKTRADGPTECVWEGLMVKCTMVYIKHSQWSECVPCPLIARYRWIISLKTRADWRNGHCSVGMRLCNYLLLHITRCFWLSFRIPYHFIICCVSIWVVLYKPPFKNMQGGTVSLSTPVFWQNVP